MASGCSGVKSYLWQLLPLSLFFTPVVFLETDSLPHGPIPILMKTEVFGETCWYGCIWEAAIQNYHFNQLIVDVASKPYSGFLSKREKKTTPLFSPIISAFGTKHICCTFCSILQITACCYAATTNAGKHSSISLRLTHKHTLNTAEDEPRKSWMSVRWGAGCVLMCTESCSLGRHLLTPIVTSLSWNLSPAVSTLPPLFTSVTHMTRCRLSKTHTHTHACTNTHKHTQTQLCSHIELRQQTA